MAIGILIVEDDPMVAEVNRQYTEAAGDFRVVGVARTVAEALRQVKALRPDLVLLDVYLPDADGVTALKRIRQSGAPADVILVTAAQDAATVQEVLRWGAIDYIIKPFRPERLKGALESYRWMREQLRGRNLLDQEQVDRMMQGAASSAEAEQPPKGLTELTLRQVLLYLVKAGRPVTVQEVADGVGLARVTARRYLDYLTQRKRVKIVAEYGTIGRPRHRYYPA